ncbi:MAG: EscU/YscU/HrcU family type III secretion system export apparatus switch protein [Planctomycetes bacterium]|nr:EscU/YscU/HrcU family type III secretion system export apparatus switch protein [Planctomycetota bacterium]
MSERAPRPMRRAVALGYRRGSEAAPRVVAKGRGDVADRIVTRAAEHGVSIRRDVDLVACLECLDLGTEIPPQAFAAVAEILAFVYALNERAASGR